MEKEQLTVYFCGREQSEPSHSFGPAVRPHYLLHFILKGKGIFQRGTELYHLQSGEVFLIRPGEMTYYEADEYEPWEYAWIGFDGEKASSLLEQTVLADKPVGKFEKHQERYQECICQMVEIFRQQDYSQLELAGCLLQMLSPLVKEREEAKEEKREHSQNSYLLRAKRYMQEHYSYDVRIQDISKFIGIDRSYLYRLFMEYEGVSPTQYLQRYRVELAKKMLLSGKYRITEAAYSCGFCDESSFNYHFRQQEQMTPREFMWKQQKKQG